MESYEHGEFTEDKLQKFRSVDIVKVIIHGVLSN